MPTPDDREYMVRALELAQRGEGVVEPNPMVGCVLVRDGQIVGEGFHEQFGGPHAEVQALAAAGSAARSATAYVTLEPCAHHGKTPPCADALLAAGVSRVVSAQIDPYPQVAGRGVEQLRAAGVEVEVGLCGEQAAELNAPYLKLVQHHRPWVIAKWAMSLDGKIATNTGESRWISGPESRAVVHQLRGRVDGIAVGRGTALRDDPLLTARPPGPRIATRLVLDSHASLPLNSRLVQTARETAVLVAVASNAPADRLRSLEAAGCELLTLPGADRNERLLALLDELGVRHWTNLLVEGGGQLLGSLFEIRAVDELQVFIAPSVIGGQDALGPVGGRGIEQLIDSQHWRPMAVEQRGVDLHVWARGGGRAAGEEL